MTAKIRFLSTVPTAVRALYKSRWLEVEHDHAPEITRAALRLVTHDEMRGAWAVLEATHGSFGGFYGDKHAWGEWFARGAVNAFAQSLAVPNWDRLTAKAQHDWLEALSAVATSLEQLERDAPVRPLAITVPLARDLLRQCGVAETEETWHAMNDFSDSGPALSDLLRSFESACTNWASTEPQDMARSGDRKAPRARFIRRLAGMCVSYYGDQMREPVRCAAAAMFDEDVDDRVVRRILAPDTF